MPAPSAAAGRPTVSLPATIAAKVALYGAMRENGITKAELAPDASAGTAPRSGACWISIIGASRMDHLERALALLGKRLDVRVRDAA